MLRMSATLSNIPQSTIPPMGMAKQTMVLIACGLCWTHRRAYSWSLLMLILSGSRLLLSSQPHASAIVIKCMWPLFARFGLPTPWYRTMAQSCFANAKCKQFLKCNGIRPLTSAPYYPASSGFAESGASCQEWTEIMPEGTISDCLARFLFSYRTTPQTTTSVTPPRCVKDWHASVQLPLTNTPLVYMSLTTKCNE